MIVTVLVLALALAPSMGVLSAQLTPEAEARSLIGVTYTPIFPSLRITEASSCTDEGGGSLALDGRLSREWSFGEAWCGDRVVLLLKRLVGREKDKRPVWRIVDAVLLPLYKRDWTSRDERQVGKFIEGDCQLDGRVDNSLVVLARLGKRNRVDWRTGVKHAWTFDVEHERIVPVSIKRVVCRRPTPP